MARASSKAAGESRSSLRSTTDLTRPGGGRLRAVGISMLPVALDRYEVSTGGSESPFAFVTPVRLKWPLTLRVLNATVFLKRDVNLATVANGNQFYFSFFTTRISDEVWLMTTLGA